MESIFDKSSIKAASSALISCFFECSKLDNVNSSTGSELGDSLGISSDKVVSECGGRGVMWIIFGFFGVEGFLRTLFNVCGL